MNIIIYGSKYGSAKKYAEELARRTGFELAPYEDAGDINGYETIVYIGALYAGGAIDYSRLNLKLKMMMALLVKKVKSLSPEKQNAETRAMLETYGKQVDFIDFDSLKQIEAAI